MSAAYHAEGEIVRHPNRAVYGWCRARERPGERLVVEVLADDAVVAEARADVARRDLLIPRVSDGRHGFYLGSHEIDIPPATIFLSAREKVTGRIFARERLRERGASVAHYARRLDSLSAQMASLRAALNEAESDSRSADRLRMGLFAVGDALARNAAKAKRVASPQWAMVEHQVRGTAFARPIAPEVSLLIWPESFADLVRLLRALADARFGETADIAVANPAGDAMIAILPALVPGVALIPSWRDMTLADAINDLAARARSALLAGVAGDAGSIAAMAGGLKASTMRASLGPAGLAAPGGGLLFVADRGSVMAAGGVRALDGRLVLATARGAQ